MHAYACLLWLPCARLVSYAQVLMGNRMMCMYIYVLIAPKSTMFMRVRIFQLIRLLCLFLFDDVYVLCQSTFCIQTQLAWISPTIFVFVLWPWQLVCTLMCLCVRFCILSQENNMCSAISTISQARCTGPQTRADARASEHTRWHRHFISIRTTPASA